MYTITSIHNYIYIKAL